MSSSGLFKLINDSAKTRIKFCVSEAEDENSDKRKARELAFDNYLHNWSQISEEAASHVDAGQESPQIGATKEGFNTCYQFTIDEEVSFKPQTKYVRQLDRCITELISYARAARVQRSHSLTAELEADSGVEIRKRFMDTVARLKRVNINVLAYERGMNTRVFDSTLYEPPPSEKYIHGPDSDYYLFSYLQGSAHYFGTNPYLGSFPLDM